MFGSSLSVLKSYRPRAVLAIGLAGVATAIANMACKLAGETVSTVGSNSLIAKLPLEAETGPLPCLR